MGSTPRFTLSEEFLSAIERWLHDAELPELAPLFAQQHIGLDTLQDLTEDDLRELGLSLGQRKRLLRAVRESIAPAPSPAAPATMLERRPMTVMFCDMIGSTALAERLEPEDMLEALRRYRALACGAIARYEGFVARFVGDGILAYFGHPVAHENDAERAVRAAHQITAEIGGLELPGGNHAAVRIGVATGMVVVGDLFAAHAHERDLVVGSTPNLAARLQTLAEPNGIIISGTTNRLVRGFFRCEAMEQRELAGFAAPVAPWRVVGERAHVSRYRALRSDDARTPFVGRADELAGLVERWTRARDGRGQIVLVLGEPGLGKSRLVDEFVATLAPEEARHVALFASPFGVNTPLAPIVDRLQRALVGIGDDDPSQRRRALDRLIVGPPDMAQRARLVYASLLPLGAPDALAELAPERRKSFTFDVLAEQFEALAANAPLVLTLEDAHWLDPSSIELLQHLAQRLERSRMLIVVTSRTEPLWRGEAPRALHRVELRRLGAESATALLDAMLGLQRFERSAVGAVVERADGVPLFLEELARALGEPDEASAPGSPQAGRPARIPATLHESLLARLDAAGPARRLAQIAAVIGEPLELDLLARVSDYEAMSLRAAIDVLVEAAILQVQPGTGGQRYGFRHALLRDAAYQGLVREQRRELHGRVAAALAELHAELLASQPQMHAFHLAEAGAIEAAIPELQRAARRALQQSALLEAVKQLERALDLSAQLPDSQCVLEQRLELMGLLGPALLALRGPGSREVEALYGEAMALTRRVPEARGHFPIYWGWWRISPDYRVMRARAEELLARAERADDRELRLQAHHCSWAIHLNTGDLCGCRRHIETGIAIYDSGDFRDHAALYGNHDAKVCGLGNLALVQWLEGKGARAAGELARARGWVEALDHVGSRFHIADFALQIAYFAQDVERVHAEATRLVRLAEEHDFPDYRAKGAMFRGWAQALLGDPAGGAASLRAGLARQLEIGTTEDFPIYYCLLAETLACAGEFAEARHELDGAIARLKGLGLTFWVPELMRWRGELARRLAPADERAGEDDFIAALALARQQGARALELRIAVSRARLLADGGHAEAALDLVAAALAAIERDHGPADRRVAEALQARLRRDHAR